MACERACRRSPELLVRTARNWAVPSELPPLKEMAAAAMAMIVSTASSSKSVKPAWRRRGLDGDGSVPNVLVLIGATLLVVPAEGEDVERTLLAGKLIAIRPAPGIDRDARLADIGAVPAGGAVGRGHQRLESLGTRRVSPDVEVIKLERGR